jgi:hypothetical protein
MGEQAESLRRFRREVWWRIGARWRRRALWLMCGTYRAHRREVARYLDRWDKTWYGSSTTQGEKD